MCLHALAQHAENGLAFTRATQRKSTRAHTLNICVICVGRSLLPRHTVLGPEMASPRRCACIWPRMLWHFSPAHQPSVFVFLFVHQPNATGDPKKYAPLGLRYELCPGRLPVVPPVAPLSSPPVAPEILFTKIRCRHLYMRQSRVRTTI